MTIDPKKKDVEYKKQLIIEAVSKGYKMRPAKDLAGVTDNQFNHWKRLDPAFAQALKRAQALYIADLIPEAAKKDPFKMLQAIYPEYQSQPDTVVNIDNRPLINAPTNVLMQILKEKQGIASQDEGAEKEHNSVSHGETLEQGKEEE